jgi:hypothetical protein
MDVSFGQSAVVESYGRFECQRQAVALISVGGRRHKNDKISSPVATTATEISSAAKKQKEHENNQEQIHYNPPLSEAWRTCTTGNVRDYSRRFRP